MVSVLYYNFYRRDNFKHIFRIPMVDKRKSLFKHPYQHRRSRRSTPDLLTPYLPGPELILPSPMSVVQTMPVYSISRSCSNLSSTPPFVTGSSSFVNSIAPFNLVLVPSSFGPLHINTGVVEDLSISSVTQSVFPSQMDWCGPPRAQYLTYRSHSLWSHSSHK